jgi:hypothetical protein
LHEWRSEVNLTLKRTKYCEAGIFGELLDESGAHLFFTLEHAFAFADASAGLDHMAFAKDELIPPWLPKLPPGTYDCVRGAHRLHHMDHDFETFEITNVPGHDKILFHVGNYNKDSEGCVLLGERATDAALEWSSTAFKKFLDLQNGLDKFVLVVQD